MSRYGRLLLRRIRLQYCDHTAPSQGLRDYLQAYLPEFKQQNPHVQVETFMNRGKFPFIQAEYLCPRAALQELQIPLPEVSSKVAQATAGLEPGSAAFRRAEKRAIARADAALKQHQHSIHSRTVGVKHQSAEEIREHIWWLRCGQGRSAQKRVPGKQWVSKQPSIQGAWTVNTFAGQQQQQLAARRS